MAINYVMTVQEVFDDCELAQWLENDLGLAVWHGGNTVNFYDEVEGGFQPTLCVTLSTLEGLTGHDRLNHVKQWIQAEGGYAVLGIDPTDNSK